MSPLSHFIKMAVAWIFLSNVFVMISVAENGPRLEYYQCFVAGGCVTVALQSFAFIVYGMLDGRVRSRRIDSDPEPVPNASEEAKDDSRASESL